MAKMKKIMNFLILFSPLVIFTILYIGLYILLVNINLLPNTFIVTALWCGGWLLICSIISHHLFNNEKK